MRPLLVIRGELRATIAVCMGLGVPGLVALAIASTWRVPWSLGIAVVFGGVIAFSEARIIRRLGLPPEPSADASIRSPQATMRRELRALAWIAPVGVLGAAVMPGALVGLLLGGGAAALSTYRRLDRWEDANGRTLLREPRFRWSGRGRLDERNLYAAP